MKTPIRISVIVRSADAFGFANASIRYASLLAGVAHEIIDTRDAPSPAEGCNRGMRQATGDILIFSRDDVLILDPDFAPKIIEHMRTFDLLGFAGTDRLITASWYGAGQPHLYGAVAHGESGKPRLNLYGVPGWPTIANIQALDGFCLIARREAALAIGFDAANFDGDCLYDLDFCFSAHLAGRRLGVCCDIPVLGPRTVDPDRNPEYAERFLEKHTERIAGARPEKIHDTPEYRSAMFTDHEALRRAWRPDLFLRATQALWRTGQMSAN
ncbi:MAG: glycosyltransferase family protein [Candidatus Accumulibacter sp.]|jgi:GT2 family glycosyltransferase|nr:glycosyltransferase family protein [Accumulibacter sp.]